MSADTRILHATALSDVPLRVSSRRGERAAEAISDRTLNAEVCHERPDGAGRIICSRECNWFRHCVYGQELIRRRGW